MEEREQQRKERVKDCIRGSLMAGAAGDALGYPVEFISRNAILTRYGNKGITQFELDHNGKALVSDSTGSITGNIMGAIYGYEAITHERLFCPEGKRFENTIELHNIILALADDLYTGCIISEYDPIETPEKKQWYARYCKMEPVGIV